jgi:cyclic pyranopterin phosphate synthase
MPDTATNIIDRFGRVHDYLRISLTERCNLRCFYCMPEEGIQLRDKAEFMTTEEIFFIAKVFVQLGVKKIRLTGGEPLVKCDIANILYQLSELPVELTITTNGVLVDKYINVFKEAGIKSINVSLDSLQRDKLNNITRRNYFDRIISNIHLLLENNFRVKTNMVVMKGVNDDEIVDFIQWTKDLPVHVRFIEFMPFNGNSWNWEKKVSYQEIISKAENYYGSAQIEKLQDSPNDTAKNFCIKNHSGTFAIISSVTNPFCDTCNRIRLTADGRIKNCLFSNNETDLLAALRAGEDIIPLIRQSIWQKKKLRAGIDSFQHTENKRLFENNRNMVTIGG